MMMSTHHMMDNHHKSATFWGKKCMMDSHHISQLISHQWHFPTKEYCHHGYIKVVSCPTRLSSRKRKIKPGDVLTSNKSCCRRILSRDLSELNFSYHHSDINQISRDTFGDWLVWILNRKREDFPYVTLVNRDANKHESHKIILSKMKLQKVKVTYDITESRSQRS